MTKLKLYTRADIVKVFKVHRNTVQYWADKGYLKPSFVSGNGYFYTEEAIQEFLDHRAEKQASDPRFKILKWKPQKTRDGQEASI